MGNNQGSGQAVKEKDMGQALLGQRLKSLRKIRHLSQEAVAEKLGIMRCTYYHYESGRTIPPAKTLYALARLYDVTPELLLYPDGEDGSPSVKLSIEKGKFTDKELELVYYYRRMDERDKDDMLLIAKLKGEK